MRGPEVEMVGDLSDRSILDVLQELHFRRATGALEVDGGEHKRRLFLRDGSLYLAGSHPLARRLGDLVKALGERSNAAGAAASRTRGLDLVQRMAQVISEWRQGKFRFIEDPSALAADLVGPLPTRRLLMLGATIGATPGDLASRLGGALVHLVAVAAKEVPEDPADLLGLGPEEQFLLERLRQPMTLEKVALASPLDGEATLRRLAQLLAARLIRVLERADPAAESSASLDATLSERFSARFERDLKENPLELSQEDFKTRVTELLARLGAMNFYELLDVDPGAAAELVQSKYETLARQVHPANEEAYGLTGLKPMLALLFERATQGYLVLSDSERRRQYNESHAIDIAALRVSGVERDAEAKELARQHFDQAQALVARGEFHFAVELLQLASKLDRRSEYLLALAYVQAKNPKWLPRAINTCRAALELEPHNAEVRYQLGQIYEQLGEPERARAQYTAAAREDPTHVQANAKMRMLSSAKPARPEDEGGLFSRIFRRRDG